MTRPASARPTPPLFAVALGLGLALLAGCAPAPVQPPGESARAARPVIRPAMPLPPMKRFGRYQAQPVTLSNTDLARDFLDLSFSLESGRPLPWMSRFEGPVTLALRGPVPATAPRDLEVLLSRLRTEARIPIHRTDGPANITVEFLPRARLQALAPQAACFVAPSVSSWAEFRRARGSAGATWAALVQRRRLAVFIPSDTSPQEVRDCLNEEIAQALGPLDDLYRLTDSVFDDDNFQNVLTGFDMLMLRLYYAPELPSGTTRAEAAERLPAILARINPRGQTIAPRPAPTPTPRAWISAIETALGAHTTEPRRRAAAQTAVAIAQSRGWQDARMAFSLFVLGRIERVDEPEQALQALRAARALYARLPDTAVQRAHVDMQLAAYALAAEQPDRALKLIDAARPVALRAQNAALLATLLLMRSDALMMQGQRAAARAARLDSIGWARYGFGTERAILYRMEQIASLSG
ncbi:hypothetical protein U879_04065 [Defluviimonas sp. 20V17]|uniref:DUF2927 domain-containing protein n=1 Tax=Allgaiera indica TaxID=765699 RepID=A0AAN5A163_9RHOB|nr:DUF2927 domain-containing protein [Allgaiera indica]KDB04921.1 hypothetical protein U879_04065 [Defluviimonas sp. 20V17]GHE05668.1 hypothetical protein GCM10008024_37330 [Allgaiera indica]SDX76021.1 Protein of unknown function [Allgaiera indica]